MSTLRSALHDLSLVDYRELPDEAVEEEFEELQRASEALEVERLRCLAELDRRRFWQRDGFLSTSSWIEHRHRLGWPKASSDVRAARALEQMPGVRAALTAETISWSAARELIAAREAEPDAWHEAEELLVGVAGRHTIRGLRRVIGHWRTVIEAGREPPSEGEPSERRRLHVSGTAFGMVRIDGDLEALAGETVITALRAVIDAETRSGPADDQRTPAQRRADALAEICRRFLDRPDRPSVNGERPHVTVTVSLDSLTNEPGSAELDERGPVAAELDHTGPIPADLARLLACDASVGRIVFGPKSEPLDVGRRSKVVPASLRRAVEARDRGCRFPGCSQPHHWCDAHHIVHWARGGDTALGNLVLLCRRHHRMIHWGRFHPEVRDGRIAFLRSDGSPLEDRAPP
jgi:hypothetical protein